ncbi:MAG: hypothetical protein GQ570_04200 [Helicobacteraceae bacterium]|nr:hypothetical protein [Helicobacteraceae bacterium]
MIFGKIEYLNLLPFHIFMKRHVRGSQKKMILEHKKGVPSAINKKFLKREVNAAFISSVVAKKSNFAPLAIVARKDVLSVLVLPNENNIPDSSSATSNALASILGLKGEVVIGDRALKLYLENVKATDLAGEWKKKYNLPFVFALLCYNSHKKETLQIASKFLKTKHKIPQYILEHASKKTEISKKDILHYLEHISYELDYKALKGLNKFWKLT